MRDDTADVEAAKGRTRRRLAALPAPKADDSADVVRRVMSLPEWHEARRVLLFAPAGHEPDITPLFASGKVTLAPRVVGRDMVPVCVDAKPGGDGWGRGAFGLWEPTGDTDAAAVDVVIVPGVAFTAGGARLGRGGGYYDRLLVSLPRAFCLGVTDDNRVLPDLPTLGHDVVMDALVTQSRTFRITSPTCRFRL